MSSVFQIPPHLLRKQGDKPGHPFHGNQHVSGAELGALARIGEERAGDHDRHAEDHAKRGEHDAANAHASAAGAYRQAVQSAKAGNAAAALSQYKFAESRHFAAHEASNRLRQGSLLPKLGGLFSISPIIAKFLGGVE